MDDTVLKKVEVVDVFTSAFVPVIQKYQIPHHKDLGLGPNLMALAQTYTLSEV